MKSLFARMQSLVIFIKNLMFEKFRTPRIFFLSKCQRSLKCRLLEGIISNFLCAVDFILRNLYILIENFAGINESRLASFKIDLY